METITALIPNDLKDFIEIFIIWVVLYFAYINFKRTRGLRILFGLVGFLFILFIISTLLDLEVIRFLIEQFSFIGLALVVLFQAELRRALAELGTPHIFGRATHKKETIQLLGEAIFELAHKQFGALIAIERDTNLTQYELSGIQLDAAVSRELILTIFQPKTALHDGGIIIRNDRIAAGACIFPVSQREDLDRNLGLRHRAGLGLSEESDAVTIAVSEETGNVSICFQGKIERDFTQASFEKRINQLVMLEKYEKLDPEQLADEDNNSDSGDRRVVSSK